MEIGTVLIGVRIAQGISQLVPKPPKGVPPEADLPPDLQVLFQSFKSSYDQKDATKLARSFSKDYEGSMWGYSSKTEVIAYLRENLDGLPFYLKPQLEVRILKHALAAPGLARVTVDFESKIAVMGIPVTNFDLGRVVVTAKMNDDTGVYLITRIDDAR